MKYTYQNSKSKLPQNVWENVWETVVNVMKKVVMKFQSNPVTHCLVRLTFKKSNQKLKKLKISKQF